MEKYYIEFKRSYKEKWNNLYVEFDNYQSAKNAIMDMMQDDFYAKDYDYEYRIMQNKQPVDNVVYHLSK